MRRKTFGLIETKADGEAGQFSALASVFGNVDHVGDRMMPGAFTKTLEAWRQSGDPIPIVLSHQWENPFALIGKADPRAVIETEKGLLIQGQLDIEHNDTARQVHRLMKDRLLKSFSFGYTVPDDGEKLGEDGANEVMEVDLVEAGPTLKGANPEAQLQAVKSALDQEVPAEEKKDEAIEAKGHLDVGPAARAHLSNLIKFYMSKPHPFTSCVHDNTKRFGEEGAKRVCATLKDIGMGDNTHWRDGGSSGIEALDAKQAESTDSPAEERDFVQELYDAAEGNFEGLMEMWHEHASAQEPAKSDPVQEAVEVRDEYAAKLDAKLAERVPAPQVKDLPEQVETEDEKPESPPVKPTAKADPLKDEIDRLRLQIAMGKPLK